MAAGDRSVIQYVWIQIGTVGPNDGAGFTIHEDLCEKRWILKRSEHPFAAAYQRRQVDRST
jgi:hypothetical protein